MNKTEILADIATIYSDDSIVMPETERTPPTSFPSNVKMYDVPVFIAGKSEKSRKDLADLITLQIVVADEGEAEEKAYYWKVEPIDDVSGDVASSTGTLSDIYDIYDSVQLQKRVRAAVLVASQDVLNEDAGTANHAERVVWAKAAQQDLNTYSGQMMVFVCLNATVQSNGGEATDNDLKYIVNSNIDKVAV